MFRALRVTRLKAPDLRTQVETKAGNALLAMETVDQRDLVATRLEKARERGGNV